MHSSEFWWWSDGAGISQTFWQLVSVYTLNWFVLCSLEQLWNNLINVWHSQREESFNQAGCFYCCTVDSWTWVLVKHIYTLIRKSRFFQLWACVHFPEFSYINIWLVFSDCHIEKHFSKNHTTVVAALLDIASSLFPQYLKPGNVWHQRLQCGD